MSKRCFLFICLNGKVSFWEYAEGVPLPCSIHGETSFPKNEFWELWRRQYRLEDDDSRDFLYLSDDQLTNCDIPSWFGRCGVGVSCWTHERLGAVMSKLEDYTYRTVIVEFQGRRSTVWYGGNPSSPLILHGISTSELALPVDAHEDIDASRLAMKVFLAGVEERQSQNEQRCKSRR